MTEAKKPALILPTPKTTRAPRQHGPGAYRARARQYARQLQIAALYADAPLPKLTRQVVRATMQEEIAAIRKEETDKRNRPPKSRVEGKHVNRHAERKHASRPVRLARIREEAAAEAKLDAAA